MKILHINSFSQQGGAETIAYALFKNSKQNSFLVSQKTSAENSIIELKKSRIDAFFNLLTKLKWRFRADFTFKNIFFIGEEFNCTYNKLIKTPAYQEADIIHLHNIHGGYFDLSALKDIAKEKKIVWTLHDMWPITGGEAHTFENKNYKSGIGKTPYIHVPPLNNPLIDRRQHFLDMKKKIYAEIANAITFVPVSHWLDNCFHDSYVWNNQIKSVVIHNGVDTTIFHNSERATITTPKILLFNSNNIFKGDNIFKAVLEKISSPFELLVVGNPLTIDNKNLTQSTQYNPIRNRHELSILYRKADILLFPSKADNFPLVPLEAMACGVCVFASNIGGIPEMMEESKTGFLFNSPLELITVLNQTMNNTELISEIGNNAAFYVKNRFPLHKMIDEYSVLYKNILGSTSIR